MAKPEEQYGDNYRQHLLEQYKIYVEMADRISARRQSANSFFLSLNTAVIALVGYMGFGDKDATTLYWFVSMAGMVLCFTWYRLIRSYKDLNTAKFLVIHEMEKELPFAPYDLEWEKVGGGENPRLYLQFTRIEMRSPWIFFIAHALVLLNALQITRFLR